MAHGVYTEIGSIISKMLDGFMTTLSQALVSGLQPILLTTLTLYFMCKAWSLMYGSGGEQDGSSMKQLTMQCIKMSFVVCFFCNFPVFYDYIMSTLWHLDEFFAKMMKSSVRGADAENAFAAIDQVYSLIITRAQTQMSYLFNAIFDSIGVTHVVEGLCYAIVLGLSCWLLEACTIFSTFVAFVILTTNTIGLAFVLAFGPLFGSLLLFPQTKQMFDGWLKTCLNFVLTKVFILGGCYMMVILVDKFYKRLGNPTLNAMLMENEQDAMNSAKTLVSGPFSDAINICTGLLVLALMILLMGFFFIKIPGIATALAGGVEMNGGGAAAQANNAASSLGKMAASGVAGKATGMMQKGLNTMKTGLRNAAAGQLKSGNKNTARLLKALAGSKPSVSSKT